ncbi:hypothetical protein IAI09_09540 [Lysinibacillus fusiformis]|nr:hypothetical protein [Lysinibacillus fusiformis]
MLGLYCSNRLSRKFSIFNVDITIYNAQITAISKTVLSILGLLGNIIDPTTVGTSDSTQALKYDAPRKEDGK